MSRHNRERREILDRIRRAALEGKKPHEVCYPFELLRIRRHGKRKLAAIEARSRP